jgi:hypothetical protein
MFCVDVDGNSAAAFPPSIPASRLIGPDSLGSIDLRVMCWAADGSEADAVADMSRVAVTVECQFTSCLRICLQVKVGESSLSVGRLSGYIHAS